MEKIYYHVSLKENEESILNDGLVPKIGNLSSKLGESKEAVYLFTSEEAMNNALMNWLGEELPDEDLVIFQVTLPSDYWIDSNSESYEIIHYDIIPSKYLKILRYE